MKAPVPDLSLGHDQDPGLARATMMVITPVMTIEPVILIQTRTQSIIMTPIDVTTAKIAIDAMNTFQIELAEAPQETAMTEKFNTPLVLLRKDTDCRPCFYQ